MNDRELFDQFAAAALSDIASLEETSIAEIARMAYAIANAMMEERKHWGVEKTNEPGQ